MNLANLNLLIDHMKSLPLKGSLGFNMDFLRKDLAEVDPEVTPIYDHAQTDCGTVACLAGHVLHLSEPDHIPSLIEDRTAFERAAHWLGLCPLQGHQLFYCMPERLRSVRLGEVTLEQAIDVLERLRNTGEVQWRKVLAHS